MNSYAFWYIVLVHFLKVLIINISNLDPVVRDDMNNYISQYYSEASSGKFLS